MNIVAPEKVGLSSARLRCIDSVMQGHTERGRFPGLVVMVARHGQIAYRASFGMRDVEAGQPMGFDTLFRLESMTKPITCAAVMMLYEEGRFQLDDPVSRYLPAFKDTQVYVRGTGSGMELAELEREISILHLLTHTSGLGYGSYDSPVEALYRDLFQELDLPGSASSVGQVPLAAFVERLAQLPLAFQPGTGWQYSLSVDVLGYLVEILSGTSLDTFLKQRIFDPLGMHDTGFYVPGEKLDRLGPLYASAEDGFRIIDAPPTSRWARPPRFLEGGGGLVSTTADYVRFLQMLLNGGELDATRLLGRKTVAFMTTNHLPDALLPIGFRTSDVLRGCGYGIGFDVLLDVTKSGRMGSEGMISWGGAASAGFWVDPREGLIALIMAQLVPNTWVHLELMSLVYQALIE